MQLAIKRRIRCVLMFKIIFNLVTFVLTTPFCSLRYCKLFVPPAAPALLTSESE